MKKFWWSGEIEGDAFDPYREAMKAVGAALNQLLDGVSFGAKVEQWAFIAIIRTDDHPDYDEVAKKTSKGKVLEFRLKIPHRDFVSASRYGQIRLVVRALSRSVLLMGKLGVCADTQSTLQDVLSSAEQQLIHKKSEAELPRQ